MQVFADAVGLKLEQRRDHRARRRHVQERRRLQRQAGHVAGRGLERRRTADEPTTIVTEDFGDIHFDNDRMLITLAFVPEGTDDPEAREPGPARPAHRRPAGAGAPWPPSSTVRARRRRIEIAGHRRPGDDRSTRGRDDRFVRAVVLVGGFGTRLRPLTLTTPKQMLPVVHRPMIEWVVGHLARSRRRRGGAVARVPARRVHRGVPRRHVRGRAPSLRGRARAARHRRRDPLRGASRPASTTRFLVVNGDVLTDLDVSALVEFHRRARRRGHDPPHAGRRSVDVRGGAHRRRRPRHRVHREAAPRRGADELASTPAPTCSSRRCSTASPPDRKVSIEREVVPGDGRRRHACSPWRPTTTGSTPARPSSTCRRNSTSSPVARGRTCRRRPSRPRTIDGDGERRAVGHRSRCRVEAGAIVHDSVLMAR